MAQDGERTEVMPERTEVGTLAASPHALGEASIAGAQQRPSAPPSHGGVSQWPTSAPRREPPTAAQVLDRSELARSRRFHIFGIMAPLGALGLSILTGGDPLARHVFWLGACVIAVCNIGLVYYTSSPARYRSTPVGVLWVIATIGVQGSIYYFGPFSAVVIVDMLGIVFIALGRARWTAFATAVICIGGHALIAVPVAMGWIADRGVIPAIVASRQQQLVAEVLITSFLSASYALGRWARTVHATALAELHDAMRAIGDREQVIAEVNDEAARQRRVNEGRWTGHKLGAYRLDLVLGRGAMGEVYEAVADDGTPAAVKLLNARAASSTSIVERFHREMEVAARLESPHIVRVFEVSGADAPVPYIAMERLHGIDLATRLRNETTHRIPSDELVQLVDQVARGLEVARLAGVVHRDLKPHNLFHHDGSVWKILDFGVSKVMDSEGTLTGEEIVGTPQYMAPEQASGGNVTHLADVYALGAIAYRCLTGRAPFKGKDLAELVYQVVHAPPIRPSTLGRVPAAIDDVLAVAMAKDPRRRFRSALELSQALIAARRGKPVPLAVPDNAWQVQG